MTTSEKRAALEAAGEPWPECDCHGEPMRWQRDITLPAGGRFHCRVRQRERQARVRAERRAAGLCIRCGGELDTESLCRPCADNHADRMAQPQHRWRHQLAHLRWVARQADFQPTGVGQAAVEAALTKGRKVG